MDKTQQIFIVGSSRSGTTMMSRVLDNNKSVFSFKELHFFSQLYTNRKHDTLDYIASVNILSQLLSRQKDGIFRNRINDKLNTLSSSLLSQDMSYSYFAIFKIFLDYITKQNHKTIACTQTPNNLFYIKKILKEYPNSKVINMIRDNRDVLLSQKNKWKRKFLGAKKIPLFESIRSLFNYHPITTSFLWRSSLKVTTDFSNHKRFMVVKFEDFLASPKNKCKEICDFLSIEFNDKMLLIPNIGSSTEHDEGQLLIDSTKIFKWKNGGLNQAEIFLTQIISSGLMDKYGYVKKNFIFPPISVLFYFFTFPIKSFFALFFNLGRFSSLIDLIKIKNKE
tara:strand:- start:2288 stop:3295 length:1008 start_codon:yes stop_codon:yes gene_type:complete